MSDLTPEIVDDVLAACRAGAEEAAGALTRGLDSEFALSIGEPSKPSDAEEQLSGPGLAMLFNFGGTGAVALVPESTGLLPEWYSAPDVTGESKLGTLAQELSMLLLPDTMFADKFVAKRIENLWGGLAAGGVIDGAVMVPLTLTAGENSGQMSLIWPLESPDAFFGEEPAAQEEPAAAEEPVAQEEPQPAPSPTASEAPAEGAPTDFSHLPSYTKSLLRVSVPVKVLLAQKKERVDVITRLSPGTVLQFPKSCEEPLELFVGDQAVAEGEAIKVGENYGFRLSGMVMPEEHFKRIRRGQAG